VTWGQFFVYQGFNDRIGWMHTSGGGDVIDEYLETISEQDGQFYYQYGGEQRPEAVDIALPYKTGDGMASKTVRVYYSHHGPIVRAKDGKWVAVRLMNEPLKALTQSYIRTKARNYKAFYKSMELRTNSVQQHRVCGRGRQYRLLPREFHPAPRSAIRLEASGGWQQPGYRVARPARGQGNHHAVQSEEWLDPEHQ
jgi:acyl-homoserine lactone acylase PvdQ